MGKLVEGKFLLFEGQPLSFEATILLLISEWTSLVMWKRNDSRSWRPRLVAMPFPKKYSNILQGIVKVLNHSHPSLLRDEKNAKY